MALTAMPTHPSNLYLFGPAASLMPGLDGPSDESTHLTRAERLAYADLIAERAIDGVDAFIDHAGGDRLPIPANGNTQFVPDKALRTGRIVYVMVDKEGNFLPVVEMQWDAPQTREVMRDMIENGEPYGFSLGTDCERPWGYAKNKRLTHIGITKIPQYGDRATGTGTWSQVTTASLATLAEQLRPIMDEPGMYVPPAMRRAFATAPATNPPHSLSSGRQDQGHRSSALVSVGATRMSESIVTPPAPPAGAAAAPPPPEPLEKATALRELEALSSTVEGTWSKLPTTLKAEDFLAALDAKDRIASIIERAKLGFGAVPPRTITSTILLDKAIAHYNKYLDLGLEETYKGEPESCKTAAAKMLETPAQSRPFTTSILATGNTILLRSQAAEEATLQAEVQERKKKEAEVEAKKQVEATAREAKLLEEVAQAKKRVLEVEAAAESNKRRRVEDEQPATGTALSVGATRGADRVNTARAFISGTTPTAMRNAFPAASLNPLLLPSGSKEHAYFLHMQKQMPAYTNLSIPIDGQVTGAYDS